MDFRISLRLVALSAFLMASLAGQALAQAPQSSVR